MKNTLLDLYRKDGTKKVLASLLSILAGLIVGSLIVIVVGLTGDQTTFNSGSIGDGIRLIFAGVFCTGREAGALTFGFNPVNWGNLLFRAVPILMTGLSVAVAFKTGLFNIGASGQYLMGTAATLYVALSIPTSVVPAWVVWLLAFLAGMLAGAIWGAIPGLLKATRGINEVLACIMTNWIAANIVTIFFSNSPLRNAAEAGKIGYIMPTAKNGVETAKLGLDKLFPGSQVNGGIVIAILIAIAVYVLMNKTTLGYELKACGANRHAARYAGIKDKRNIVLSMAISGALAAGGASLYYLSGNTEFAWQCYQILPAEGFNGIPVALLAVNNPIGIIFSAAFMSMLTINGQQLKSFTAYNAYITDIIIAAIVYLSSFSLLIKMILSGRKKATAPTAPAAPAEPQQTAEPKSAPEAAEQQAEEE